MYSGTDDEKDVEMGVYASVKRDKMMEMTASVSRPSKQLNHVMLIIVTVSSQS